jgi:hypothetical protein
MLRGASSLKSQAAMGIAIDKSGDPQKAVSHLGPDQVFVPPDGMCTMTVEIIPKIEQLVFEICPCPE